MVKARIDRLVLFFYTPQFCLMLNKIKVFDEVTVYNDEATQHKISGNVK